MQERFRVMLMHALYSPEIWRDRSTLALLSAPCPRHGPCVHAHACRQNKDNITTRWLTEEAKIPFKISLEK